MLDALRRDLVRAVRDVRRSPAVALGAVGTLAVGIGATTAIFSVVDGVLLRPLAYRSAGELVALFAHEVPRRERRAPTSPADFLEWRKSSRTVEQLTAAHGWSPNLTGRGAVEELHGLKATRGLFELLGVPPVLGRAFDAASGERQVVLGHGLWQRRFGGDPAILGRSLVLDGRSYVVSAVMPEGSRFPPFWVADADVRVTVEALQEPVLSRVRPALLVLAGAVGLVLLIACANVASLLLAQGVAREKEAAVRAALGASRGRLVGQALVESALLAFAGGVAGLALAHVAVTQVVRLRPAGVPRLEEIAVDGRVAAFSLGLCLVAGVVAGLVPALRSSRPSVSPSLKQGDRLAGGARHRLHDLLVVAEFAMAVVLVVGASLLARSFLRLQRSETGFRADGLSAVTLSLSGSPQAEGDRRQGFLADVLQDVAAVPGVEPAAFVNHVPIGGDTWRTWFAVEGRPSPDPAVVPQAVMRTATAGYLEAMGIPLLLGRDFDAGDRAGTLPVVLVNRALTRAFWPDGGAVGARIKTGRLDSDTPWRTIVGVFADASQDPTEPVQPEIVFPYTQDPVGWYDGTTLVLRSLTPRTVARAVEPRVSAAAPEVPIKRVRAMSELLSDAVAQERLGALLMGLLSLFALALSRVLRGLLHGVSPTDPATFAAAGLLLLAVAALASLLPARRAARLDPVITLRAE